MSEFLERFSEAFMAVDHGDRTKMEALIADDIVMWTPQGEIRGRDAVLEKFNTYGGAFSEITHDVDFENDVIDAGDSLAVEFTMSATHTGVIKASAGTGVTRDIPPTFRRFTTRTTDHVWWRDGKIYRFNIFFDPTDRLRQLGIDLGTLGNSTVTVDQAASA